MTMPQKDPKMMEKISRVQAAHADALMMLPNVVGVGIGNKQVDGEMTDELALVVLVEKKVPNADLPPESLIPPIIEGIPTDVQEAGGMFSAG